MAVARQQFDVFHRQIEPRLFGIFQQQAFMGGPCGGDDLHPLIAPDAVIHMHHQIARGQRLRLGQEILGLAALFRRADQPVAQHVLFRDHGDPQLVLRIAPWRLEALLQPPDRQMQAALADAGGVGDRDRLGQTLILDEPGQTFARAFGP